MFFIDDLACVVKDEEEVRILLSKAQLKLAKLGLFLNWDKPIVQTFRDKDKFKTYVYTPCVKEEGWVNSMYRDHEFRWVYCPPLPSLDRV